MTCEWRLFILFLCDLLLAAAAAAAMSTSYKNSSNKQVVEKMALLHHVEEGKEEKGHVTDSHLRVSCCWILFEQQCLRWQAGKSFLGPC